MAELEAKISLEVDDSKLRDAAKLVQQTSAEAQNIARSLEAQFAALAQQAGLLAQALNRYASATGSGGDGAIGGGAALVSPVPSWGGRGAAAWEAVFATIRHGILSIVPALAVFGSISAFVGNAISFLRESYKEATTAELVFAKLRGTLAGLGADFASLAPVIREAQRELMRFGVGTTETASAMAMLLQRGFDMRESMAALRAGAKLAVLEGTSLTGAVLQLTRAAQGFVRPGSQLGQLLGSVRAELERGGDASENLAKIIARLESFDPAVRNILETSALKARMFRNELDDLKQSLGELIAELVKPVRVGMVEVIGDLRAGVEFLVDGIRQIRREVDGLSGVFKDLPAPIRELLTGRFGLGVLRRVAEGVGGAIADLAFPSLRGEEAEILRLLSLIDTAEKQLQRLRELRERGDLAERARLVSQIVRQGLGPEAEDLEKARLAPAELRFEAALEARLNRLRAALEQAKQAATETGRVTTRAQREEALDVQAATQELQERLARANETRRELERQQDEFFARQAGRVRRQLETELRELERRFKLEREAYAENYDLLEAAAERYHQARLRLLERYGAEEIRLLEAQLSAVSGQLNKLLSTVFSEGRTKLTRETLEALQAGVQTPGTEVAAQLTRRRARDLAAVFGGPAEGADIERGRQTLANLLVQAINSQRKDTEEAFRLQEQFVASVVDRWVSLANRVRDELQLKRSQIDLGAIAIRSLESLFDELKGEDATEANRQKIVELKAAYEALFADLARQGVGNLPETARVGIQQFLVLLDSLAQSVRVSGAAVEQALLRQAFQLANQEKELQSQLQRRRSEISSEAIQIRVEADKNSVERLRGQLEQIKRDASRESVKIKLEFIAGSISETEMVIREQAARLGEINRLLSLRTEITRRLAEAERVLEQQRAMGLSGALERIRQLEEEQLKLAGVEENRAGGAGVTEAERRRLLAMAAARRERVEAGQIRNEVLQGVVATEQTMLLRVRELRNELENAQSVLVGLIPSVTERTARLAELQARAAEGAIRGNALLGEQLAIQREELDLLLAKYAELEKTLVESGDETGAVSAMMRELRVEIAKLREEVVRLAQQAGEEGLWAGFVRGAKQAAGDVKNISQLLFGLGERTVQTVQQSFDALWDSFVTKTKKAKEAFRDLILGMLREVSREGFRNVIAAILNPESVRQGEGGAIGAILGGAIGVRRHGSAEAASGAAVQAGAGAISGAAAQAGATEAPTISPTATSGGLMASISGGLGKIMEGITGLLKKSFDFLGAIIGGLLGGLGKVLKFSSGGVVLPSPEDAMRQPVTTDDRYLVAVRGGEGFVRPEAVQYYGVGFIEAVNRLVYPKLPNPLNVTVPTPSAGKPLSFAAGGVVPPLFRQQQAASQPVVLQNVVAIGDEEIANIGSRSAFRDAVIATLWERSEQAARALEGRRGRIDRS